MADVYPKPADSNPFGFDEPKALSSSQYSYPPETLELGSLYGNMASISAQIPQLNEFAFLPRKDGGSQEDTTMEDIQPSPHGADQHSGDISPGTFTFNQFTCPPPEPDFALFSDRQTPDNRTSAFSTFPTTLEREIAETETALNQQDVDAAFQDIPSSLPDSFPVNPPSLSSQNSPSSGEQNFRFLTTLHTPTAMTGGLHEPPVSYLNRNSVYCMTVRDNSSLSNTKQPVKYRTTVRVGFDQEEERSDPSAYWKLWNEAREKNDGYRQKRPCAVEYAGQSSFVEIEQQSFDGFSVTWVGDLALLIPECNIPVRFNFLSTDFTRSKGVKGIPLRLCAKTTQISMENTPSPTSQPDTCYCRIKLFRDHGAERKLSNDRTNMMKAIEKVKKQVDFQDHSAKSKYGHKRADSKSGPGSGMRWGQEARPSAIRKGKLASLQKAMSSAQPQSVLSLRGDEKDDPDLSTVQWLGGDNDLGKVGMTLGLNDERRYSRFSSTESSDSRGSPRRLDPADTRSGSFSNTNPAGQLLEKQNDQRVACFYARLEDKNHSSKYYRAIYLRERTVRDLAKNLVRKHPNRTLPISRVLYMNRVGLKVDVDDGFVREIPEGQDMVFQMEQAGDYMEIHLFF